MKIKILNKDNLIDNTLPLNSFTSIYDILEAEQGYNYYFGANNDYYAEGSKFYDKWQNNPEDIYLCVNGRILYNEVDCHIDYNATTTTWTFWVAGEQQFSLKDSVTTETEMTKYALSNLKEYECVEGEVYTKNKNETLDNMVIQINNITEQIDIEPYDEVLLDDSYIAGKNVSVFGATKSHRMLVDSFNETMSSVNPKIYNYEINLFSKTKLLENGICPNLSITPNFVGDKLSIYDYIVEYMRLYCPKQREVLASSSLPLDMIKDGSFTSIYMALEAGQGYNYYFGQNNDYYAEGSNFYDKWQNNPEDIYLCVNGRILHNEVDCHINTDGSEWTFWIAGEQQFSTGTSIVAIIGNIVYLPIISVPSSDSSFANKFSDDCPELQWNNPTLREVLNDLFMIKDCIPIVNANNELDFMDLTSLGSDITNNSRINYIQRSQSSSDYTTELYMNMQNVMNTSIEDVASTTTCERLTFVASKYTVTSEDFLLKTQFPILTVKHLWAYIPITVTHQHYNQPSSNYYRESQRVIAKVDLCNIQENGSKFNFVKEKEEYNSLRIVYRTDEIPQTNEGKSKIQNCCVYYSRYSNEILGFTQNTKNQKFLFFDSGITNITTYLKDIVISQIGVNFPELSSHYKYYNDSSVPQLDTKPLNLYYSMFFEIEYETLKGCVFRAGKTNKQNNNDKTSIDTQTNSFIDVYTQGNLEYQKVNRFGNVGLMINQRIDTTDNNIHLIDIGDFYEDNTGKYIVYSVQYQNYKNHIEVNASATKDYVLQNYFTGVKQKVRTAPNAKNEAFERNNLIKLYCEFSINEQSDDILNEWNIQDKKIFLSSILPNFTNANYLKNAFCSTFLNDNKFPPDETYTIYDYALESVLRIAGKSIIVSTGLNDNYNVTISPDQDIIFPSLSTQNITMWRGFFPVISDDLTKDPEKGGYGGIPLVNRKYVTELGNFDSFRIAFGDITDSMSNNYNNYNVFPNAKITNVIFENGIYKNYITIPQEIRTYGSNLLTNLKDALNNTGGFYQEDAFVCIGEQIINYEKIKQEGSLIYFEDNSSHLNEKCTILPPYYNIVSEYGTPVPSGLNSISEWFMSSFKNPIIPRTNQSVQFSYNQLMRKDNKEIPYYSFQFEYNCITENIYFTKYFLQYMQFVRTTNMENLKFYASSTYIKNSLELPSDAQGFVGSVQQYPNSNNHYYIAGRPSGPQYNYTCYYITDNNNKVIFGINNPDSDFYFSLKSIRNDNIYDYNGIIVDKL